MTVHGVTKGRTQLKRLSHTHISLDDRLALLPQLWGCCCIASVVSDFVRPHRQQPTRLLRPWESPGKNTGVACHFLLQCMKVKGESEVPQSCLTLSNPMDCSLPGSSIHGIFQARVLEWGAIVFSSCGASGKIKGQGALCPRRSCSLSCSLESSTELKIEVGVRRGKRWGGGGEQGRMRVGPGFWKAVFFFISFSGDSDIQSSGEATDKV